MSENKSYKIGELASMFGITSRTIRYYEEMSLLEAENREESQHRHYNERNVVRLKRIQQLKDYGLSLSEIKELFDLARSDRSGKSVKASLSAKYKERLLDAQKRRQIIDNYIEDLSWHIEQLEKVDDFFDCPGSSCKKCTWASKCTMNEALEPQKQAK